MQAARWLASLVLQGRLNAGFFAPDFFGYWLVRSFRRNSPDSRLVGGSGQDSERRSQVGLAFPVADCAWTAPVNAPRLTKLAVVCDN